MPSNLEHGLGLARALRKGKRLAMGWSSLPEPLNAVMLARGGFRAVCVDMQHGFHDEASMIVSMQGVHQAGAVPGLRIPVGRFDLASRALDSGAQFIIAPMINSVEDARALVAATKYPPVGERSWGPTLAMDALGADPDAYLSEGNELVITLAMIETLEARDALEEILGVPGIDGVFVGPSDLSIALSQGQRIEAQAAYVREAAADIGARTKEAGKIAGVYAVDAQKAKAFFDAGFTLAAVGSDAFAIKAAAAVGSSIV